MVDKRGCGAQLCYEKQGFDGSKDRPSTSPPGSSRRTNIRNTEEAV